MKIDTIEDLKESLVYFLREPSELAAYRVKLTSDENTCAVEYTVQSKGEDSQTDKKFYPIGFEGLANFRQATGFWDIFENHTHEVELQNGCITVTAKGVEARTYRTLDCRYMEFCFYRSKIDPVLYNKIIEKLKENELNLVIKREEACVFLLASQSKLLILDDTYHF